MRLAALLAAAQKLAAAALAAAAAVPETAGLETVDQTVPVAGVVPAALAAAEMKGQATAPMMVPTTAAAVLPEAGQAAAAHHQAGGQAAEAVPAAVAVEAQAAVVFRPAAEHRAAVPAAAPLAIRLTQQTLPLIQPILAAGQAQQIRQKTKSRRKRKTKRRKSDATHQLEKRSTDQTVLRFFSLDYLS